MKLPPGYVPGVGVTKATAYGGFGEKLLKQYGWKDGEGLGAEGGGIKTALKVLKKDDNIGVGARQVVREKETADWWQQSFDSAALSLRQLQDDSSASESSDDSDSEAETPTGKRNRDGTLASGTRAELRLARELAKDPWGRFGGRGGKLARIRQQEAAALAAMQGVAGSGDVSLTVARPQVEQPKKKRRRAKAEGPADATPVFVGKSPLEAPPAKKCSKKSAKNGKPLVDECKAIAMEPAQLPEKTKKSKKKQLDLKEAVDGSLDDLRPRGLGFAPEVSPVKPKAPWWGASLFVSSGCLEGLDKQPKQSERRSFTEDTQTDLYNRSQATKTAGKKGLGVGQGKAAGHEWRGSKVVFEDPEDCAKSPTIGATLQGDAANLPEESLPQRSTSGKVSSKQLRKLTCQILKKNGKRKLKVSKLGKHLADMKPPDFASSEFQALAMKKISGCPKLAVEGKYIVLCD